jgi:pimeloyl-ACP methyl ester carboxylesterase
VGDRTGADNAWELAATRPDRFTGLVALDRGHPRAPDLSGVIRDERCPPVEINTTVLVSSRATASVADASQRFVYGEHRLVVLPGRRSATEFTAQFAMEIVLRASTW